MKVKGRGNRVAGLKRRQGFNGVANKTERAVWVATERLAELCRGQQACQIQPVSSCMSSRLNALVATRKGLRAGPA